MPFCPENRSTVISYTAALCKLNIHANTTIYAACSGANTMHLATASGEQTPRAFSLEMMEVVVTTLAIRHGKLHSRYHHQQTNTQLFTGRMPFLSPIKQSENRLYGLISFEC